jgi:hypothetical protein
MRSAGLLSAVLLATVATALSAQPRPSTDPATDRMLEAAAVQRQGKALLIGSS